MGARRYRDGLRLRLLADEHRLGLADARLAARLPLRAGACHRHRDRSGGDAPARRCLGGIQTGRHAGHRADASGPRAMDLEPHDLSGAAPPLQQRHLGPRVDQDLLQRRDRLDPGPGRRHRAAAVPLPHPDGRHHAGQRRRPHAHLAQRVERHCQCPQRLDHRLHAGRTGGDPHRTHPHPVGLRADAAHRQRLRGVGHRAPALHSDDLRGCDHPGPLHRVLGGLSAPEPLHPGVRERGARDHPLHCPLGPAPVAPARAPAASEPRARLPPHVERHRPLLRRHDHRRRLLGHHRLDSRPVQPQSHVGAGHRRALGRPHRRATPDACRCAR